MRNTIARRDFLAGTAGFALAAGRRARAQALPPTLMYVGSYTSRERGHGEGISVYGRRDPSTPWALVQIVRDLPNPSFLAVDREGRCLYSAHGDGTQASAYRIDPGSGRLTLLNQQPTGGENGVHLAIDGTGRYLVVANYASGTLALLPIARDGSLGELADLATLKGEPGPHRTQQTSSHPHHCPFDRTGRFVLVPDKGLDRTFVFGVDAERGKLVEGPSAPSRPGAAPRHVDFHPAAPYAYVINELDSTMAVFRCEPEKGELQALQVLPTLPSTFTGNNSTAEVWVAPSGRFVYGSNRGHDSIAIFAVDGSTGLLTPIGWESTRGRTPRYFGFDPTGTHLYAANQNSDTVVIFRVDPGRGALTPTDEVVKVASPSTIVFR